MEELDQDILQILLTNKYQSFEDAKDILGDVANIIKFNVLTRNLKFELSIISSEHAYFTKLQQLGLIKICKSIFIVSFDKIAINLNQRK